MPAPARRTWRPLATAAAGASLLSLSLYGAYATAVVPAGPGELALAAPGRVRSGTLALVLDDAGAGFSTPVTGLAPGDVVHRHVDLRSTGTLDGRRLSLQVLAPAGRLADELLVTVTACEHGTWAPLTGTCSGTPLQLLGPTPVAALREPVPLRVGAVRAGAVLHLQAGLTLPAPGTAAGARTDLSWVFRVVQRA